MNNHNESQEYNVAERLILRDLLLAGKRINKAEFINITGNSFSALAQRVYDLRQEGYRIVSEKVKKKTGKGHYCYYRLCPIFAQQIATYGLDIALRGELLAKQVKEHTA